MQLVLGLALGLQPMPLLRKLDVAIAELVLFGLNVAVTFARTGIEQLLTAWVPCHVCSLVLGLLLAARTRDSLGGGSDAVLVRVALLTSLMLFPVAQRIASFETQIAPIAWLSALTG